MIKYRTKNITVSVQKAGHGGILLNEYPKDFIGDKNLHFKEGDLVIIFDDDMKFPIHPEFGKRLLERVSD